MSKSLEICRLEVQQITTNGNVSVNSMNLTKTVIICHFPTFLHKDLQWNIQAVRRDEFTPCSFL